jgi:ABC-type antimicrobial peptide transport system permease subunit
MMKIFRTFVTALRALRRNVTRAALTCLGIMIGVGAVIAMMEIGQGSSSAIQRTVSSMGANNLMIFPGNASSSGVSFGSGSIVTLTPDDADAILRDCPAVKGVAPVQQTRTQLVYGGKNWVPQSIYGTTPMFADVRNWQMQDGEMFSDRDVRNTSKVCLVGQTIVRELFGGESPIGKEVRVNNVSFKVTGTLAAKGANMMGMDQDDIILAPWTSIKYRVSRSSLSRGNASANAPSSSGTSGAPNTLSNLYPSSGVDLYPVQSAAQAANNPMPVRFTNIDQIVVSAQGPDQIDAAVKQVTELLRERHRLRPGENDDFVVRNMTEFTNALTGTTELMTKLLLSVALISLIVGGVGIMNIMLVSVTERTREIGLRMAVGARARDILRQFLTEAVVLSLLGGAIGIALGIGGSWLVNYFLRWPIESSPAAVVAAFFVSASVGVIFGYYPAWKASRLDPIEALRYE